MEVSKVVDCWLKDQCKQLHCNDENGCLILYKLNYLYDEACIPMNLRKKKTLYIDADGKDRDAFVRLAEIQNNILSYVNNGKNLYLYSGQTGNGKTSWAIRLIQAYLNKIWFKSNLECKVLFISVPEFLVQMKNNISSPNEYYQHIIKYVYDCDLVVWDDIASKNGTEYEIGNLLSIINHRINKGKSNFYTSNISPQDLSKLLDIRLASRVCNQSEIIQFVGGDKRHFAVTNLKN